MTSVPPPKKTSKAKPHVLGLQAFAAISAVEGLSLDATGRARLNRLQASSLSPDERRAEILKAYKKRDKK